MLKSKIYRLVAQSLGMLLRRASGLSVYIAERLNPQHTVTTQYGPIKLICRNELTLWRAHTFYDKEPDTLAWIDSFQEGEILYDIGANIGLYTLYAAKKGIKVHAFEPESQNYALLNYHIYINGMQNVARAYLFALSNITKIDYLYVSNFSVGGALNNFGVARDFNQHEFTPDFKQPVISYSLDVLIEEFNLVAPHYIKIDVDGLERQVVDGARQFLTKNQTLKSILIELNENLEEDMEIVKMLEQAGFTLKSKYHAPMFDGTRYQSIYNYIFYRCV